MYAVEVTIVGNHKAYYSVKATVANLSTVYDNSAWQSFAL